MAIGSASQLLWGAITKWVTSKAVAEKQPIAVSLSQQYNLTLEEQDWISRRNRELKALLAIIIISVIIALIPGDSDPLEGVSLSHSHSLFLTPSLYPKSPHRVECNSSDEPCEPRAQQTCHQQMAPKFKLARVLCVEETPLWWYLSLQVDGWKIIASVPSCYSNT